jgi:hypothetical protein
MVDEIFPLVDICLWKTHPHFAATNLPSLVLNDWTQIKSSAWAFSSLWKIPCGNLLVIGSRVASNFSTQGCASAAGRLAHR